MFSTFELALVLALALVCRLKRISFPPVRRGCLQATQSLPVLKMTCFLQLHEHFEQGSTSESHAN